MQALKTKEERQLSYCHFSSKPYFISKKWQIRLKTRRIIRIEPTQIQRLNKNFHNIKLGNFK
jgi:hypothetical protein